MITKSFQKFIVLFVVALLCVNISFAQTTVSGTVTDFNGEPLIGINIIIKDKLVGASTDLQGAFSFTTKEAPPFSIIVSGVAYQTQEIEVTENDPQLDITLVEDINIGDEIVVSVSRVEQSTLESPVSIEKMDILDIQQTASDNFYDGLANLKGVDLVPSGMLIKMVNARGFGGPYQTRFVQRFDGMDMQSPSLSLPFGNIAGIHDIDVESVEIQPGAASALYGPSAFNGIMNMTSKNPFLYQGLTAQAKFGFNNVNNPSDGVDASPYYEVALRYGKSFNNKFAFKVNFSYFRADDWIADDQRLMVTNPLGISELNENTGTNGNALNTYGDENGFALDLNNDGNPDTPLIHRTGYKETDLFDYQVENIRADATLYYRPTDNLEVSYMFKYAEGNGALTGGNRYVYNPEYFIHKFEVKGSDFFLRAYNFRQRMTDESYDLNNTAYALQNLHKDDATWYGDFGLAYATNGGDIEAARATADAGRLEPGSEAFNNALETLKSNNSINGGTAFTEVGDIFHAEGQYDFTNLLNNIFGLTVGASYRRFQVDSDGTIFLDGDGRDPISYFDVGAYIQANKSLLDNKLNLLASIRYDKSEFFDGLFTPRAAIVFSPVENHNFRASYQTGFKNPIFQEQSIFFPTATGIILAGGREGFIDRVHTGPRFDLFTLAPDVNDVITVPFVEPENVTSWEFGYKAMITPDLFLDISYNRNIYENFIGVDLSQLVTYFPTAFTGTPDPEVPDAIYAFYTNLPGDFRTEGVTAGVNYTFGDGFNAKANYTWSNLLDELPVGFLPSFNTPEHKMNVSFGNREVIENLGFNVTWRWQSEFDYIFGLSGQTIQGKVESFSVLDAQVTYRIRQGLTAKLGGANIFNEYYTQALGAANIGGQYYLTLTFDQFGR